MIELVFPDGAARSYPQGTTGRQVAESIAPSLAKRAALVKLDGETLDLSRPLNKGGAFQILTRDDPESLFTIRHDVAHVLAEAVQSLFPGTQVTIGPPIEDGFYYDFAREEPFSTEDFPKIEAKMREIVDRGAPFERSVMDRNEAIAFFEAKGEKYKAELIRDLPETEEISLYSQGEWIDLCRGPHFPTTKHAGKAFKLTKLAGAYWRGDHRNAQLQRIYGTAWANDKDLEEHLRRIEEAEKRDHRRVGRTMDLFHFQEEGRGMVFWHPHGWTLYRTLESYMRRRLEAAGYQEIRTPQVLDRALWEKSGHWQLYGKNMFVAQTVEGETLAVKPMNCPGHVQVFNVGQKSYRDLPLRLAEFGSCHRYEPSGALHGLMRVRQFVQDDAHIFCRPDQVNAETKAFVQLLRSVYDDIGMTLHAVKFSTRPDERAGSDETWDMAEAALAEAAEAAGITLDTDPGEGAFYGPKLDFSVKDAIGRTWQLGTLQLDPNLPERLGAEYVSEDGSKQRPFMLHRAILGSFERFIGIMIENFGGAFPLWLAPVQAVVATIVSEADPYAEEVLAALQKAGVRAELDVRNEKIGYKVREHSLKKVPVIVAVGRKEAELRTVALRRLGSDGQVILSLDEALEQLGREVLPPDLARAAGRREPAKDALSA